MGTALPASDGTAQTNPMGKMNTKGEDAIGVLSASKTLTTILGSDVSTPATVTLAGVGGGQIKQRITHPACPLLLTVVCFPSVCCEGEDALT